MQLRVATAIERETDVYIHSLLLSIRLSSEWLVCVCAVSDAVVKVIPLIKRAYINAIINVNTDLTTSKRRTMTVESGMWSQYVCVCVSQAVGKEAN